MSSPEEAEALVRRLVGDFLQGRDRGLQAVWGMEQLLHDWCPQADVLEELSEPLALYRPGAGEPYVDAEELASLLRGAEGAVYRSVGQRAALHADFGG